MKCAGCGLESERDKFFRAVRRTFSRRTRSLCPACFLPRDDAVLKVVFRINLGLGLAGLFLVFAFPNLMLGACLLNIGVLLVGGLAGTILHEVGHAVAGKLVGFRVFSLEIGKGATIWEFKWAGFRWRFRTILFGGLVLAIPRDAHWHRLKQSIFIIGGPAATALVVLIAWKLLWLDSLFEPGPLAEFTPLLMILLSNSLLLALSLLPHEGNSARGKTPNDALLLVNTWIHPPAKADTTAATLYLLEAEECRRDHDLAGAQNWLAGGLRAFPGNRYLEFGAASMLISAGKPDEARDALRALLPALENDPALFPILLNNIAWVNVWSGRPELLPEADDFSRRALESAPSTAAFRGTRGRVLVELGRIDEGVALLEDVFQKHLEKANKASVACCLGIAAARRGQPAECRNYFALARKLDAHCLLLARENSLVLSREA